MPENPRSRDCVVLFKEDCYTVSVSEEMAAQGWRGGQGLMWTPSTRDEPTVTISDGFYSGFAVWGSDESSDQFTAQTRQFPTYRYAVQGSAGWIIMTTSFEHETWRSRHGLEPPGTPLVYHASDQLLFSLRGFWTIEDEWTLAGDPRAPNGYFIGFVVQAPSPLTDGYMTIQTGI